MRTTIRLDDRLLAEAKSLAARSGKTLTEVIEDALRESLARAGRTGGPSERMGLPTFGGEAMLPGVDLDDSAALLDAMERDDRR